MPVMTPTSVTSTCVFCQEILIEPPTTDGWIRIFYNTGIHYRCVEKLHDTVTAIKKAKELGEQEV